MIDAIANPVVLLSIIDDIISIFTWGWWLWLFVLGWFYYKWAQDHLSFSPLLTLVVGGILVYFLVIEHPIIGSFSVVFWILLTSGILYLMPMTNAFFNTFIFHKGQKPSAEMEQEDHQQYGRQMQQNQMYEEESYGRTR